MESASCRTCTSGSIGALSGTVSAALRYFAAAQCLLSEPYPPQAHLANESAGFDFIIVGAGTGGSALAARLVQADYNVLLVEAGGDPPQEAIIPSFFGTLNNPDVDWDFYTVDDGYSSQSLPGRGQFIACARMLGGSGSHNGMYYARGHPVDYQEWADIVGPEWNWTNVLPYFKKTEQLTDQRIVGHPELMRFHGTHGEIEVSGQKNIDPTNGMLLDALLELGFDLVDDMTYPYKIGAGRISHTIRNGRRDSTVTALLNKVNNYRLHVLKHALATKILINNGTAVGIKVQKDGKEFVFYAKKEVIISAGTFNTPKLLMLSGIGPKSHLEELGIEVVVDLPVGNNYQDHPLARNFMSLLNGTCNVNEANHFFETIKYLYDSTGSLSYANTIAAGLPKPGGRKDVTNHIIYPSCFPVGLINLENCVRFFHMPEDICKKISSINKHRDLVMIEVALWKPLSRGQVRLNSTDPLDKPLIYANTFSNLDDLIGFPEAVQKAFSLVNTSYFRERDAQMIIMPPGKSCKGLTGLLYLECQIKEYAMSGYHPVGSVAMGAVLDEELKVFHLKGLRVVDGSVMPATVRGNTNAPIVMIAEKAADFIKNAYANI